MFGGNCLARVSNVIVGQKGVAYIGVMNIRNVACIRLLAPIPLENEAMTEGDPVTKENLKQEWQDILSTFDILINAGHSLRPIRFIIRHIIEKGYDSIFFPGSSLYSLLISIPTENRIDFSKTLRIEFDEMKQILKFEFKDRTGVPRDSWGSKEWRKWKETCQATEGTAVFDHFVATNEYFRTSVMNLDGA
jgi:hypothetical protein